MTDTEKRDAVLAEYRIDRQAPVAPGITRITAGHDWEAIGAEIVKLREAVARVRAVHNPDTDAPCDYCAPGGIGPCPTLTALEGIA